MMQGSGGDDTAQQITAAAREFAVGHLAKPTAGKPLGCTTSRRMTKWRLADWRDNHVLSCLLFRTDPTAFSKGIMAGWPLGLG